MPTCTNGHDNADGAAFCNACGQPIEPSDTAGPIAEQPAAGWFDDPTGRHANRYWDGSRWTSNVGDAGVPGTDEPGSGLAPPVLIEAGMVSPPPQETAQTSVRRQESKTDGSASAPNASPTEPVAPAVENFAVTIGDIGVTKNWVVTPNGNAPVAGSRWIVLDQSRTSKKIPSWAIVMAILFAVFCLIGLLFLLVKEDQTTGYVEVTVMSGSLTHVTQVPIRNQMDIAQIRQRVHQAQTLAAAAQA